jgi:hypothetical protein
MYDNIGKGIEALFYAVIVLLITAVPLAVWKLIDIATYLFNHIEVSWK